MSSHVIKHRSPLQMRPIDILELAENKLAKEGQESSRKDKAPLKGFLQTLFINSLRKHNEEQRILNKRRSDGEVREPKNKKLKEKEEEVEKENKLRVEQSEEPMEQD